MTSIEIIGGAQPPDADSDPPLSLRFVALAIVGLVAAGGVLAALAGEEPAPSTEPGDELSPATVPTTETSSTTVQPSAETTSTTLVQSTVPPTSQTTIPPNDEGIVDSTVIARPEDTLELPPVGAMFDLVVATDSGVELRTIADPSATITMAGPRTRLAFGFDGPVIVHQAGDIEWPDPELLMIRITTPQQTRIAPTEGLHDIRLLDAAVIEGHPIILYSGKTGDSPEDLSEHLYVFDLETAAFGDVGEVGWWEAGVRSAYFSDGDILVHRSESVDDYLERWDLDGTVKWSVFLGSDRGFTALPGGPAAADGTVTIRRTGSQPNML